MTDDNQPPFTLYTYFRSSCSARLRIALNIKNITTYDSVYINLLKNEQSSPDYDAINPSHSVPSLKLSDGTVLTQSLALLEYLEERYPAAAAATTNHATTGTTSLLPPTSDVVGRARVRALANLIACDVQPVTNLRIFHRVTALGGAKEEWARDLMNEGLSAYEKLASLTAGKYSYGDSVTMADVCLVPAIWGALRFGVDLERFHTVKKIYENMSELDAVKRAHWKNQKDTPEELRS